MILAKNKTGIKIAPVSKPKAGIGDDIIGGETGGKLRGVGGITCRTSSKLTVNKNQRHQFFLYLNIFVKLIKIPIYTCFSEYQKDYRRRYVKRIRSCQKLEFKIQQSV